MSSYATILVFCSACTLCANWQMRICALVLVMNFLMNEAVVRLSGEYTPWAWFLATDTASLFILTASFAGRIGAILAATYATQIVMHLSFAVSKLLETGDAYAYWSSLTAMAWLQLLILFAGSMRHGCIRLSSRIRVSRGLRYRVPVDTSPYSASARETRGEDQ